MNRRTLLSGLGAGTAALLVATPLVTAPAGPAWAESNAADTLMQQIMMESLLSLQMSQLALRQLSCEALRGFAQLEIAEQQVVQEILVANGAPTVATGTQMAAADLGTANIDQQYLVEQMRAHESLLQLNQAAARLGPTVPAGAAAMLAVPAIESHLAMLRMIRSLG